jgi:hypothetical protein
MNLQPHPSTRNGDLGAVAAAGLTSATRTVPSGEGHATSEEKQMRRQHTKLDVSRSIGWTTPPTQANDREVGGGVPTTMLGA